MGFAGGDRDDRRQRHWRGRLAIGRGIVANLSVGVLTPGVDHAAAGQRQRMIGAGGDRDHVTQSADLHRRRLRGGAVVTKLAAAIVANRPDGSVRLHDQRVTDATGGHLARDWGSRDDRSAGRDSLVAAVREQTHLVGTRLGREREGERRTGEAFRRGRGRTIEVLPGEVGGIARVSRRQCHPVRRIGRPVGDNYGEGGTRLHVRRRGRSDTVNGDQCDRLRNVNRPAGRKQVVGPIREEAQFVGSRHRWHTEVKGGGAYPRGGQLRRAVQIAPFEERRVGFTERVQADPVAGIRGAVGHAHHGLRSGSGRRPIGRRNAVHTQRRR